MRPDRRVTITRTPASRVVFAGLAALALGLLHVPAAPAAPLPGPTCEKRAARELRACGNAVARQHLQCVKKTGAICPGSDAKIAASLARLAAKVLADCPDGATVAAAGYPAALTPAALVDRLQESCGSMSMSLVARAFGGPQAAVRAGADRTAQTCLDHAYGQGRTVADYAFWQRSACLQSAHAGRACDATKIEERVAAKEARAAISIARRCTDLAALVAVDPATFVQRASDQGECMVPTAHGQTAPFSLACGPRAAVPVPARGVDTQVVLDGDAWGTRCGDGSDYAFWVRLAPPGNPVERIVVFLPGGGSCIDGPTCASTSPDLFESVADTMGNGGLISSTAATNPFRDWTKVFLPYCTQDGHTGGGVTNVFPEMTVHRFGALNVRAALRWVRDALWAQMDATDAEGFRPDRLTVLFSGSSAGGLGAQFNYHYLLDDLRWTHSTLLPDSSLGLDNGAGSAAARGAFVFQPTTPGWNGEAMAPPYCHDATCAEGWNRFLFTTAPRLKATPEQQVLSLTNQLDATQRNGSGFASNGAFVNALRTKYCEQRGTPGLHAYLPDSQPQEHGNITDSSRYNDVVVDGVLMRDWLFQAMTDPDGVIDRVGTGLVSVSGVLPFPCAVGSPSGAFLDGVAAGF